jgi:segregation and condensation protein A
MSEPSAPDVPAFEEDADPAARPGSAMGELVLSLGAYDGPIDILLALARDQKVDLKHISILALAEQYVRFIETAQELQLEIAADYLVMAAWLAYLKSKLLLPPDENPDQPSAEEMAEALKFQLLRLEAMQEAGRKLFALPIEGVNFFRRGMEEDLPVTYRPVYDVSLYDLLKAYAAQHRDKAVKALEIEPFDLFSIDEAIERLRTILPGVPDWTTLFDFLPRGIRQPLMRRSAISTTLIAALELVRQGKADIRQESAFSPIFLKPANRVEVAND